MDGGHWLSKYTSILTTDMRECIVITSQLPQFHQGNGILLFLSENYENSCYRWFSSHIIYIHTFINYIYIGEPSGDDFLKLPWHIYIHIYTSIKLDITVIYFDGAVCFPLIFVSYRYKYPPPILFPRYLFSPLIKQ